MAYQSRMCETRGKRHENCTASSPLPTLPRQDGMRGTWEQNYDGFPEVICREFHGESAGIPDFFCEDCAALPDCTDCGDEATTTAKFYTGPDTYIDQPVCAACWLDRDNAEPPDPDGEDMFRDYQAEARDAAADAMRLKR